MILFVDAYDSFSRNIVALLYQSIPGVNVHIIHIDTDVVSKYSTDLSTFLRAFDGIVLGPGPGDPRDYKDVGLFEQILRHASQHSIPALGVCLGFQSICLRHGYTIGRMPLPCHGQAKLIRNTKDDIFSFPLADELQAMSYNSLAVNVSSFVVDSSVSRSSTPATECSLGSEASVAKSNSGGEDDELQLLAWDDDGYVMAVRHPVLPLWGLQFHPESCMSRNGMDIMGNWWSLAVSHKTGLGREADLRIRQALSSHATVPVSSPVTTELPKGEDKASSKVSWSTTKLKSFNSQDLSQLCYESTSAGDHPIAMLESSAKGRFSICGFTDVTSTVIQYNQGKLRTTTDKTLLSDEKMSPAAALKVIEDRTKELSCTGGCPDIPFWGGWIGCLSYEMGLDLLEVDSPAERDVPDFSFVFVDRSVVLDQSSGNIYIQTLRTNDQTWVIEMMNRVKKIDKLKARPALSPEERLPLTSMTVNLPRFEQYRECFQQCQEHLHAGNSYELCLTTEARVDVSANSPDSSYELYENLNKHNPVPFAAFLRFPKGSLSDNGMTVLSTSPEQFLSCSRNGTLDMIPMKGTVQRTASTDIDDVCRVLQSPKETAENLMIADLIRHDLYSVVGCKPYPRYTESPSPRQRPVYNHQRHRVVPAAEDDNNPPVHEHVSPATGLTKDPISIPALNSIKAFDTVYQLVSHIRAKPPPSLNINDPCAIIAHNHSALQHVLPAGSMTGAPKKRSCEILQKLEHRNRGVYSGIIGYMDIGGGCSWSVAIRTAWSNDKEDYVIEKEREDSEIVKVEKRKVWHVGAGGAITVLSTLEGEWKEMMGKMNNVLKGFRE